MLFSVPAASLRANAVSLPDRRYFPLEDRQTTHGVFDGRALGLSVCTHAQRFRPQRDYFFRGGDAATQVKGVCLQECYLILLLPLPLWIHVYSPC